MRPHRFRSCLVVISLLLISGCYHFVPADPSAVTPGTRVRAEVTDNSDRQVQRYVDPRTSTLDGELVQWDDRGLVLLAGRRLRGAGGLSATLSDTLHLPSGYLGSVQAREMDWTQTVAAVALGAGGAALAVLLPRVFSGGGSGDGPDSEGDEGAMISIPISIPGWFR